MAALTDVPNKKLWRKLLRLIHFSEFILHTIAKTNELFYAGAVVTNRLRVKTNLAAQRKEPLWRRILQYKIKEVRKDCCRHSRKVLFGLHGW